MSVINPTQTDRLVNIELPLPSARQHMIREASYARRALDSATKHLNTAEKLQNRLEELQVKDPKSYKRKQVWKAIALGVATVSLAILGIATFSLPIVLGPAITLGAGIVPVILGDIIISALILGGIITSALSVLASGIITEKAIQAYKERDLDQIIEHTRVTRDAELAAIQTLDLQQQQETLEGWQEFLSRADLSLADVQLSTTNAQDIVDNIQSLTEAHNSLNYRIVTNVSQASA